jgi:hypothetical protein
MQTNSTQVTSVSSSIADQPAADEFIGRLRRHATTKTDWKLREVIAGFHTWADRFNTHFGLGLSTPAIGIDKLPASVAGRYRPANGFGIDDEVVISFRHLQRDPVADVLDTLLHEMLHQWQQRHGQPGAGGYHNEEFQAKARELGIPCDAKGMSLGAEPNSPFGALLKAHGIEVPPSTAAKGDAAAGNADPSGSKVKKWSCGCTSVRCEVELHALCERCGKRFLRVLPAENV